MEERHEVEAECLTCGNPYVSNGYEESQLVELEIKAYRRLIRRQRKSSTCDCGDGPERAAAPVDRLFPNTCYGVGVWGHYVFQRYSMYLTVGGFCRLSESCGVVMSKSTLINRNVVFLNLFGELCQAIVRHQGETSVGHGDETGWPMLLGGPL